ncbi:hypothetical protein [Humidesulfovibrio idahonensis]
MSPAGGKWWRLRYWFKGREPALARRLPGHHPQGSLRTT